MNPDNEPHEKKIKLSEDDADSDSDISYSIDSDAMDMLDEVELDVNGHFPSVAERYLTAYYQLDVQKPGDDMCIRVHSNRICMITLAPSHTIFTDKKTIESINFKVSDKLDRQENKVTGKAKHGAQPLQSNSNLCQITCSDGSTHMIKCCMIGKLVEVNNNLTVNPDLLKLEPHHGGYIAIVLPNLKHLDRVTKEFLNQEQYAAEIDKRIKNQC